MKQFNVVDVSVEGEKCSVCIALWKMGVLIFSSFTNKQEESINFESYKGSNPK